MQTQIEKTVLSQKGFDYIGNIIFDPPNEFVGLA
jgi:hypothetical protein